MGAERIQLDLKLLRSLEPLSHLSVDKLADILSKSVIEELPEGRILFRQGESDTRTYYLLSGQIEFTITGKRRTKTLKAKSSAAKSPIEQSLPRTCTARTKTEASTLAIDTSLLEILLCDDHMPSSIEVTEISAEIDAGDWMLRFLQSRAFLHLPTENIQSLLMRMEEVSVKRNQTIVKQGGKDKYYYIVKSGRCTVLRRLAQSAPEIELTTLSIGDGFGEEALIADSKRNATVRMLEDGRLMRLARQDFISLLVKPLLKYVDQHTAASLVKLRGALLIDVRSHEEFSQNGIAGAINIPLSMLRTKIASLSTSHNYVVYCSDGSKSAAAAFLLNQQGIQCCILARGLASGRVGAADRTKKQQAHVSSAPKAVNRAKTTNQTTVATDASNCTSPVEQEILQLAASAEEDREMAEQRSKRLQQEADLIRKQAEALAKKTQTAETSRRKAEQAVRRHSESERLRLEAETARQALGQLRSEAECAQKRQAALEKDRQQAKQQAKLAAKMAGEARTRAEEETRKLRVEAENIRSAAQEEATRLRAELEASRLQMEEETKRARAQSMAAQRVSEAAEKAVHIKAQELARVGAKKAARVQAEAEATKRWAIEESARIRAEAELARQQAEDEAHKTAARAKVEVEAAKRLAEEEVEQAIRAKAEAEVAKQWAMEEMKKATRSMAGTKQKQQKQQIQKQAERTARALAEAEQARRVAEAEEYARARIEAQNAAQAAAEQETKRPLVNEFEKKEQTGSVIFEPGNFDLSSEEISDSNNSFSLAKSSVKEDRGRIILEGERDIFIFERPTTADGFNEDEISGLSDCLDFTDEDEDEEDNEQLPSFVVDTHSDSADIPEEVDIVFEDSIIPSQDESAVQLFTIREKAPPARSFDGISRKTGNKYPFAAMAAGIIVVLSIGTFAIFNETYINMNKVIAWVTPQNGTEETNTIKTRQLAQIVAAQLKAEKAVKNDAESEYARLLKQWKKNIASQLATPQINTIEEKTNSN